MVGEIPGLLLVFLSQFAGGPGAPENNLVRFGLAAIFWAVLLFVAWSRQRHEDRPREKLLVWGFGLALFRELLMLVATVNHIVDASSHSQLCMVLEPIEHALGLASVVMIAGSFMRYILDDASLTRRYLQFGLGSAAVGYVVSVVWWNRYVGGNPGVRFHATWPAWLMHVLACAFIVAAMVILVRKRGWLRNVVLLALSFLFLADFLLLLNYVTGWQYSYVLCPIANSFHIWAAPLFGFVYFREQSIEKKQAEDELEAYRHRLEEQVTERTTDLTAANEQLQWQIKERKQAQAETARRNTELAAQNAIAATLSQSLDLDAILGRAMDWVVTVMEMDSGCIYLLDVDTGMLASKVTQPGTPSGAWMMGERQERVCQLLADRAVTDLEPVMVNTYDLPVSDGSDSEEEDDHHLLVSAPLISYGRAVGALVLATRRDDEITPQQIELLTAIGQQIGMAVENVGLYQETQRWASGMALLHEVSVFLSSTFNFRELYDQIAQQSAQLIGCPVAHLFMWEEGRETAERVASYGLDGRGASGLRLRVDDSPILPELMTQRQPIAVKNAAEDPRIPASWRESLRPQSLLWLPIWGGSGGALGFLLMIDLRQGRRWRAYDVDMLKNFVDRAAIALENARLQKQLEWAAALEERQRLAAEMHDGLAQTLSYLGLKTDRAAQLVEAGQPQLVPHELSLMQDALGRATREIRLSIASLQETPRPRQSLQTTLRQIIAQFAQHGGTTVEVQDWLETPIFPAAKDLENLSRVVQEALLNAYRHASAWQILISLRQKSDHLEVEIVDDGQGFDPERVKAAGGDHFGLSIMQARAARIEGKLSIETQPGQGTRVLLTWPLRTRSQHRGGDGVGDAEQEPLDLTAEQTRE